MQDEIRVGYSGELSPFSVIPNIVGKPRYRPLCGLPREQPTRVGADVVESVGLYHTKRPMDHGTVCSSCASCTDYSRSLIGTQWKKVQRRLSLDCHFLFLLAHVLL
jgi:actin-related protein